MQIVSIGVFSCKLSPVKFYFLWKITIKNRFRILSAATLLGVLWVKVNTCHAIGIFSRGQTVDIFLIIPLHTTVVRYYGITLAVRVSVRPYFCFRMVTWVNVSGFSPNMVWALILWISGLGLLMGKFHQLLTVICPRQVRIFISGW